MVKTYPEMINPFMYVASEDADGVVLYYRTSRTGFCPYLSGRHPATAYFMLWFQYILPGNTGILIQIAKDFYNLELTLQELPRNKTISFTEDGYQFRFRLNFNNRDYMADQQASRTACINLDMSVNARNPQALAPLSSFVLMQLFPFTLVFRKDLQIIAVGVQLLEMFPAEVLVSQPLPTVARMCRPKLSLTWDNVTYFKLMRESFTKPV